MMMLPVTYHNTSLAIYSSFRLRPFFFSLVNASQSFTTLLTYLTTDETMDVRAGLLPAFEQHRMKNCLTSFIVERIELGS